MLIGRRIRQAGAVVAIFLVVAHLHEVLRPLALYRALGEELPWVVRASARSALQIILVSIAVMALRRTGVRGAWVELGLLRSPWRGPSFIAGPAGI